MSSTLHFAEHTLQEVALIVMPGTTRRKGIVYSWGIIAMPWAMESSRSNLFMWLQFVAFHLGVVAAITLSFVIPYGPGLLTSVPALVTLFQVSIGAACAVGVLRMIRRFGSARMRALSSPDDYFSLLLLTAWFFFAALSASNDTSRGETILLVYFWMTAFFLVYVPFSKISHYLYYPFTRYYFGKSMGHRGVFPLARSESR
jgi:nitrate reductase gamma subunit